MRPAIRLLAAVQRNATFLEPGAPTGLTGLLTHASPRSRLLFLYSTTLERLAHFPEESVYRQSVEALTRHRMGVVEAVKPSGLEDWQRRMGPTVEQHPEAFRKILVSSGSGSGSGQEYNIVWKAWIPREGEEEDEGWFFRQQGGRQPKPDEKSWAYVRRSNADKPMRTLSGEGKGEGSMVDPGSQPRIEPEPALTAEQVGDIEGKIGAGLIEEVIQVAEGERELVDTLLENKV